MFNLFRLCRKDEISFDIVAETGNNIVAIFGNDVAKLATLLPKTATMLKQHSTLSKQRHFTINSFDTVAVFGNKVECCIDIVAGVHWASVCMRLSAYRAH